MSGLAIVDLETTGLQPYPVHAAWEVALIVPPAAEAPPAATAVEYLWQIPADFGRADPKSLALNHWAERRWPAATDDTERQIALAGLVTVQHGYVVHPDDMAAWANRFADLTRDKALIADNVGFDKNDHLERLLRAHGTCPAWHYRGVCAESLLAGWLHHAVYNADADSQRIPAAALSFPWSHSALLEGLNGIAGTGITFDPATHHTALGDTRRLHTVIETATGGRA